MKVRASMARQHAAARQTGCLEDSEAPLAVLLGRGESESREPGNDCESGGRCRKPGRGWMSPVAELLVSAGLAHQLTDTSATEAGTSQPVQTSIISTLTSYQQRS